MVRVCLTLNLMSFLIAHATKEHINFYKEFLKSFAVRNPVLISTDRFENSLIDIAIDNYTSYFIKYTTNNEEWDVANLIMKLYYGGNITLVLFIDDGHQNLLKILNDELRLFDKGLAGLLAESDVAPELKFVLRLDTLLYLYSANASAIKLKEMYAINGNTIISQIGAYEENGFSMPVRNLWDRRTNMEGMEIKAATVNYPMLHELIYEENGKSIIGGKGFFIDPLNILSKELNFSVKYMSSIDGQWGAMDINGTWNGLIGMLVRGQADMAAAGLSQTIERTKVTTFGRAFELEEFTLMSPQATEQEPHIDAYLRIFPSTVWCIICAMLITFGAFFVAINYCGINYLHDLNDSEEFTFLHGMGLSLTFFRQIYYNINLESISSRILFMISAMSTYLLYVHYTAFLIATSATNIADSPIGSFQDVISGGYQVFVVKNSADHGILRNAKAATSMHDVYYNTMIDSPGVFLESYKEMSTIMSAKKSLIFCSPYYMVVLNNDVTRLDIEVIG